MSPWIDVDDEDPNDGELVLIWPGDKEHATAIYQGGSFLVNCCFQNAWETTHWMRLPEGPDEEEDRRQAEDVIQWGRDHRCPRCGSTLNRSGPKVWCSLVGGGEVKPCLFGLDEPVTVEDVEAIQEANP